MRGFVQVQPTRTLLRLFLIPPTAVGGWFRSSLDLKTRRNSWILRNTSTKVAVSVVAADRRLDLNKSTNCRWWDSDNLQPDPFSRSDLNNPRTAVRGILDFSVQSPGYKVRALALGPRESRLPVLLSTTKYPGASINRNVVVPQERSQARRLWFQHKRSSSFS